MVHRCTIGAPLTPRSVCPTKLLSFSPNIGRRIDRSGCSEGGGCQPLGTGDVLSGVPGLPGHSLTGEMGEILAALHSTM